MPWTARARRPARRAQCAECRRRRRDRRRARDVARARSRVAGAASRACRTARSGSPRAASSSSTTARRPTPTPRPARWPATTDRGLDRRRHRPKQGGIEPLAASLPAHRPRLSDRPRRAARLRAGSRPAASRTRARHARGRGGAAARAPPRRASARRRRAAVAGLRLLRSVHRLRCARRSLPRASSRRSPRRRGRHEQFLPRRPHVLGRWWWTVDRWTLAALAALIVIGAHLCSPPARRSRAPGPTASSRRQHLDAAGAGAPVMLGVSLLRAAGRPARRR